MGRFGSALIFGCRVFDYSVEPRENTQQHRLDKFRVCQKHGPFSVCVTLHDLLTHTLVRRLSNVRRCAPPNAHGSLPFSCVGRERRRRLATCVRGQRWAANAGYGHRRDSLKQQNATVTFA